MNAYYPPTRTVATGDELLFIRTVSGPSGEGYLRCCFATSLDKIEEAAERMGRFVKRVRS